MPPSSLAQWQQHSDGDTLTLALSGQWTIANCNQFNVFRIQITSDLTHKRRVIFNDSGIVSWDSSFIALLIYLLNHSAKTGSSIDYSGLPDDVQGLLQLASAVPERQGARRAHTQDGVLTQIGNTAIEVALDTARFVSFTGEISHAVVKLLAGKAQFRKVDLWLFIQDAGVMALPIVTLISLLVGMILAFVGAHQLAMFGAQIFIADAVAIGMAREMGAMMTAIIMAGRTGAAFAAQLGTMQVNQEVDAFKTMGFSPMEFLVLPRMLALVLMMPLLTIYADFTGIIGGALVATGLYDISVREFINEVFKMLDIDDFIVGLVKSCVFGILVAMAGCMRGIQCGRSSSAVGLAATSAVVSGILLIVVSDAIMTIITTLLDF